MIKNVTRDSEFINKIKIKMVNMAQNLIFIN